ncbi:hypothetical protein SLE2022_228430 [Rubroshorea leprosula]
MQVGIRPAHLHGQKPNHTRSQGKLYYQSVWPHTGLYIRTLIGTGQPCTTTDTIQLTESPDLYPNKWVHPWSINSTSQYKKEERWHTTCPRRPGLTSQIRVQRNDRTWNLEFEVWVSRPTPQR